MFSPHTPSATAAQRCEMVLRQGWSWDFPGFVRFVWTNPVCPWDKPGENLRQTQVFSLFFVDREVKRRFRKRVVLANVPSFPFSFRANMRTYPRSGLRSRGTSERTLVPLFVPGEHPPKPPFLENILLGSSEWCVRWCVQRCVRRCAQRRVKQCGAVVWRFSKSAVLLRWHVCRVNFARKIFFEPRIFVRKMLRKFSPKLLSLRSVGQKKSPENSSKFPTKFSKFPCGKSKNSPTSFCRSAGRRFWRMNLGNGPNTVSESTVSNTELGLDQ